MVDVSEMPDDVVDALAASVAAVVPLLKSRIPPFPAAQLGRTGASLVGVPVRLRQLAEPLLAERLLGALELTVSDLSLDGAPDLSVYLPAPGPAGPRVAVTGVRKGPRPGLGASLPDLKLGSAQPRPRTVGVVNVAGESEALASPEALERFRPGSSDLAATLLRRLSAHRLIAPLLIAEPTAETGAAAEQAVAAAHGAAYLALGVAVGWAVTGQGQALRGPALPLDLVAAAVGLGIAAAREMLVEVPMPQTYAEALLEKVRAEYLLPRTAQEKVQVTGHRFALTEKDFPDEEDFSGNGLVAVVPGGAVIRTGTAAGPVTVLIRAYAEEPSHMMTEWWDEVVEVSWHADRGLASVIGPGGEADPPSRPDGRRMALRNQLRRFSPPWPGDYRLRVYASGRDDPDDEEQYELHVWQAPPAPEIAHKRTDRLGHRLRGEPEPAPQPRPWKKYREICGTVLDVHGTITVVTGGSAEETLRAFGVDPDYPESLGELVSEMADSIVILPVTTDGGGPAAIVIENSSFQGMGKGVLEEVSANGRAASFHQNAKGLTNLAFAAGGRVLESYEPFGPPDDAAGPAVQAAVEGLDFADVRDHGEKCLFAVERFTGRAVTPADLQQIRSVDVGYRAPG